jgi:hypothetical protein
MVIASCELVNPVRLMATIHLVMAKREVAPAGSAKGAAETAAVVLPAQGAFACFDQDSAHGFVRFLDWSINHVSSLIGAQGLVNKAESNRG